MRYVIGSGPSGVMCAKALLDAGLDVTLLDVGRTMPDAASRVAEDLAGKDPASWTPDDLKAARGPLATLPNGIPKRMAFGSDYAYAREEGLRLTQEGCHCSVSHAKGGFSAIWGGSVLPNRAEDFADWPVTLTEMIPHYKAVGETMGIAASETDPLLDWFPHYAPVLPAAPRSAQAEHVFAAARKEAFALERAGIRVGEARLALRTAPDREGRVCRNVGLCLSGCPFAAVYSSAQTLDELAAHPKFRYVDGHEVKRFEEREEGVTIVATRLSDGAEVRFEAERLYLGCGALATALVVAASLPDGAYDLPMTYQPYFLIPLLLTENFPDVERERVHALNQLNVEVEDERVSPHLVHLQLSTFNHFVARKLDGMLRFFPLIRGFLRRRLLGRVVTLQGYAHGAESEPIRLLLKKTPSGVETILRGAPHARLKSVAAACVRKLAMNARRLGMMPVPFMTILGVPGIGSHSGAIFPMREKPGAFETDRLGRLAGRGRVHLIDGAVLSSIPAATITYTIMANAHRIGAESAKL